MTEKRKFWEKPGWDPAKPVVSKETMKWYREWKKRKDEGTGSDYQDILSTWECCLPDDGNRDEQTKPDNAEPSDP